MPEVPEGGGRDSDVFNFSEIFYNEHILRRRQIVSYDLFFMGERGQSWLPPKTGGLKKYQSLDEPEITGHIFRKLLRLKTRFRRINQPFIECLQCLIVSGTLKGKNAGKNNQNLVETDNNSHFMDVSIFKMQ